MARNYWLLKSEPDPHIVKGVDLAYAFERLAVEPGRVGRYTGVRNPQARNFLRDKIKVGDHCFFYHSSCKEPGIAGIVEVVRAAVSDDDALNPAHPLFDEKHTAAAPRWYCIDVKEVRPMSPYVSLKALRAAADALPDLKLLRQPRLSVQPVSAAEWDTILGLEAAAAAAGSVAAAPSSSSSSSSAAAKPAAGARPSAVGGSGPAAATASGRRRAPAAAASAAPELAAAREADAPPPPAKRARTGGSKPAASAGDGTAATSSSSSSAAPRPAAAGSGASVSGHKRKRGVA